MTGELSSGEQKTEVDVDRSLDGLLAYIPTGSTIPDDVWARRHKYFIVTVLVHVPVLFGLGMLEGTEPVTGATLPAIPLETLLLEIGIIVAFAGAAAVPQLGRRLRTVLAVTGLAFCSGTLVHVSGGYIEAHFHFFVAIGIAAIYEDWLPFGVGITYVVVTHGLFGMIDPSRVYNHTAAQLNPWVWGVIHGGFVAVLAGALTIHLSSIERSRKKAQRELQRARERATQIDDLEERQAEIEREKAEAEQLKTEAERQREEVEELNAHLQEKTEEYRDAMSRVADGDLTVRVDPESQSEAMAEIGHALNDMTREIEGTVTRIQSFAAAVETQTSEADSATRQVAEASQEVSDSIQEIATGTDDQRRMLDEASGEVSDFSAAIEEVAASAQEVAQVSDETTTIAADGRELADEMLEDARSVQASIDTTVETVDELETQMDAIAEITDVISDIAEQTNLLALNANIEAARAGDGGNGGSGSAEGFDVVANEVKQLAEETQDSAGDIRDRIAATQSRTDDVVSQVERASDLMEREIEAVTDVVEVFERVASNAERTDDGVREISETTDSQAASIEEVVSMIDEVTEISDGSAAEAESVSAAVEEQTASMDEISESVSSVATQAGELEDLLTTFVVDGTGTDGRPDASATPTGADP